MMKRISKIIATVLLVSMLAAMLVVPASARSFPDVQQGDWYYYAISTLTTLNVIDGFPDGSFYPNAKLTVAQFLKLVAISIYPKDVPTINNGVITFEDGYAVTAEHWASGYYYAAVFKGIVMPRELPASELDREITRYEMSLILYRIQKNVYGAVYEPADGLEYYVKDYADIPSQYLTAVRCSYGAGMLQGDEYQYFNGSNSLSRAEGATVIMRLLFPAWRLEVNFWTALIPTPTPTPTPSAPVVTVRPTVTPRPTPTHSGGSVSDDWFSDAVIFGNSLVGGLSQYSGLVTPDYIYVNGISVYNVGNSAYPAAGTGVSMLDALGRRQYSKVIIELGVNELGSTVSGFSSAYKAMIEDIQRIQPDADIYIQTVVPVTEAKSNSGGSHTIEKVIAFNEALRSLAAETGCTLIDTYAFFANDSGYLPSSASWDGVHLNVLYYSYWAEFLCEAVA